MPSRQRVSTRSEGSTSTPARAAVPSQRTSTHNPPKPAPSPYRTRHRRVVRGPELAEREGGAQDLVPPSDDEEYDEWRAVRAVARVQDDEHGYQAELALEPEQPVAGPSKVTIPAPRDIFNNSGALRPRSSSPSQRRFVPLFDDEDWQSDSSISEGSAKGKEPEWSAPASPVGAMSWHSTPSRSLTGTTPAARQSSSRRPREPSPSYTTPTRAPNRTAQFILSPDEESFLSDHNPPGSPPLEAREPSPPEPQPPPQATPSAGEPSQSLPPARLSMAMDIPASATPPLSEGWPDYYPAGLASMETVDAHARSATSQPQPLQQSQPTESQPRQTPSHQSQFSQPRRMQTRGSQSQQPQARQFHVPEPLFGTPRLPRPPSSPAASRPSTQSRATPAPSELHSPTPQPSQREVSQRHASQQLGSVAARTSGSLRPSLSQRAVVAQLHISQRVGTQQFKDADVPMIPADPALLQFRSARTFRTRTALQLNPYTKERQLYESIIRRGGAIRKRTDPVQIGEVQALANERDENNPASDSSLTSLSDEETTPPDAIVIGNTPPPRQARKPKELEDEDYDEYFLRFGEAAVDDDPVAARRLQVIARQRLRTERETKRREREEIRLRKQFDLFLLRQANGDVTPPPPTHRPPKETAGKKTVTSRAAERTRHTDEVRKDSEVRESNPRPSRPPAKAVPGRPKTYARRDKATAPISIMSDSDLSDPPLPEAAHDSPLRPRHASSSPVLRSPSPDVGHFDFDNPWNDDDGDNDIPNPDTPVARRNSRPPPSTKRRRLPSSSSQSGESSSDDALRSPARQHDKRQRIAQRMLPGVMLKRLEREQKDRDGRKAAERRRQAQTESPVRPGHAVVRRGHARAGLDGITDLFDDSPGSSPRREALEMEAEEGGTSSDDGGPIVISSDSGSEAMEDNRAHESLARLHRGDFEGIVRGRAPGAREERRDRQHGDGRRGDGDRPRTKQRKRDRRPALGLVKRIRAVPGSPPERLVQSRIDFPIVEAQQAKTKRHTRGRSSADLRARAGGHGNGKTRRPAIRLDDRTIFADDDFAFESEREVEVVREVRPRNPIVRVSSKKDAQLRGRNSASPRPQLLSAHVDEGVGRARSWANFDRFPFDFNISPLPSGVYCDDQTIPGSGRLALFLQILESKSESEPKPRFTYGVDLHATMSVDEADAVLPVILDGMHAAITAFVDAPTTSTSRNPDLAPIGFFKEYLGTCDDEGRARLFSHFMSFGQRLDEVSLPDGKHEMWLVKQLLLARYGLLELAALASPAQVVSAAAGVIHLLLAYGFDRTIRSLKQILRHEAETPVINDYTVGVWVAVGHLLSVHGRLHGGEDPFLLALLEALDQRYPNEIGPLAAERLWFLLFGLCALNQFGVDGTVCAEYTPYPRWSLVKRAIGLIKITHSPEAEEAAHIHQLRGRDRYVKTILARCLRLSSTWRWSFDRESFSVATRDLGFIFKDRQHRNLPTESATDFPQFITEFDIALTASEDTRSASAFELYLRLASVAASDLIASAEVLTEAHQAERDVQRLIMSIFPLSAVPFTRVNPPTARQLGALINRYSTMVVACYFTPVLLPWLLANSQKWTAFEDADFESRQVCIRGLMYLAVACRHHNSPLDPVISRFADILGSLQNELAIARQPGRPARFPTSMEIERTMVLVVTCIRQIILHPGYAPSPTPVYPDPALLNECWTGRIFELDLAKDLKAGLEIVCTIQTFLDVRATSLPNKARRARETLASESIDEYPSLGFDFDDVDLVALGGDEAGTEDPTEKQDAQFAEVILSVICPKIYHLLTHMLPPAAEDVSDGDRAERQILISKLTKCWSDCAAIVVVEHRLTDWSSYFGPFGNQSWARVGSELGRIQVGLHFMLNVLKVDPAAFRTFEEEFVALLFQSIVSDRLTIEHKYASTMFALPSAADDALFEGIAAIPGALDFGRASFMDKREAVLEVLFVNAAALLRSKFTPATMKSLLYRCLNVLISALILFESSIDASRVLHQQSYRIFASNILRTLQRVAGEFVTTNAIPALRSITWA